MFCLTCFDIVEDRARSKVVKILKEYGVRVQKSVFECANITEEKFLKMKDRVEGHIDSSEDTVRYYFVCKSCLTKMEYSGIGMPPQTKGFRVV